jgi:hypothetical protein
MAHSDDIKAIRDYVVTQVESAWPGLEINRENPEKVDDAPNVMVRIHQISYPDEKPLGITQDVAYLEFEIGGRWDEPRTSNQMIEDGAALRLALLSSKNPADKGLLPRFRRVLYNVDDELTGLWTMVVVYTVYLMAARS